MNARRQLRRTTAITVRLGIAALIASTAGGFVALVHNAARPPTTSVAYDTGSCMEWMCGTNHNQVLV